MTAYVIFLETIQDHARFAEYRKLVMPTLEPFGGTFVVRGGHFTVIEGDWPHQRCVVIEFPSREMAEGWYWSEDYRQIAPLRLDAMQSNAIIVDGLSKHNAVKLDPFSQGFVDLLRTSYPHLLDLASTKPETTTNAAYVEVIIPSPVDGPFQDGLYIQTLNEEITVGFGEYHQHFNEWNIGKEEDATRNTYEVAMNFVDRVLSEDLLQVTVEKEGRYFASWLEPSDSIEDIRAGRASWMNHRRMMGVWFEFDREASYTVKVKSWKGAVNTEMMV